MQAATLRVLEKRFAPEDARLLVEAIEEEIKAAKLVTADILKSNLMATESNLKCQLAETTAELVRWVFMAIIGQTTLLTGIMYFLPRGGK